MVLFILSSVLSFNKVELPVHRYGIVGSIVVHFGVLLGLVYLIGMNYRVFIIGIVLYISAWGVSIVTGTGVEEVQNRKQE